MKNNYNAENLAKYIDKFIEQEEDFNTIFFERLSCMFTTLAYMCDIEADTYYSDTLIKELWKDIESNCDIHFTSEDYDEFYNMMVKWIV